MYLNATQTWLPWKILLYREEKVDGVLKKNCLLTFEERILLFFTSGEDNKQFQCKLRLILLVKAKPTSFWLVYIHSKYTSIYFFMDFVFVLTFVKPTLTSIWLALTIASLEETLSEGVRRPQLWILGQDEHLWRRWAFICASQLVRFKGKLDFQGNRDFQTLNLGFPGHFDRFWVFQK